MKTCLLTIGAFVVMLLLLPVPVDARSSEFMVPSSRGIDRPGSMRFQYAAGVYAHCIGNARYLQPEFSGISS